jgi:ribosomal protein S10
MLDISDNPLDAESQKILDQLKAKGVEVKGSVPRPAPKKPQKRKSSVKKKVKRGFSLTFIL